MRKETFYDNLLKISNIINKESYFSNDGDLESKKMLMTYATRKHGNVGDEEHSQKDVEEAQRVYELIKPLLKKLKLVFELEVVDEWVTFSITPPQKDGRMQTFDSHLKTI
jgi:hypothetical protein